jgi:hypothetical protein
MQGNVVVPEIYSLDYACGFAIMIIGADHA